MATATKICKVCGNEYEYCHTDRRVAGVFRWVDVACCPEHGNIYLARVLESRGIKPAEEVVEETQTVKEAEKTIVAEEKNDSPTLSTIQENEEVEIAEVEVVELPTTKANKRNKLR